jgi:hypothetical protein
LGLRGLDRRTAGFIPARFSNAKDLVCLDFRRLPVCDDEAVTSDPRSVAGWLLEILAGDEEATEAAPQQHGGNEIPALAVVRPYSSPKTDAALSHALVDPPTV